MDESREILQSSANSLTLQSGKCTNRDNSSENSTEKNNTETNATRWVRAVPSLCYTPGALTDVDVTSSQPQRKRPSTPGDHLLQVYRAPAYLLGPPGACLGPVQACLGPTWGLHGPIWGSPGAYPGPIWASLGPTSALPRAYRTRLLSPASIQHGDRLYQKDLTAAHARHRATGGRNHKRPSAHSSSFSRRTEDINHGATCL